MNVETEPLGEFAGVADDGARAGAAAIARISGTDTAVDMTGVSVLTPADFRRRFARDGHVGVTVELTGGFPGETLLVVERDDVGGLLEQPRSDSDPLDAADRSSLREATHIVASELVEPLAARFSGTADLAPPIHHDHIDGTTLLAGTPGAATLAFESRLSGRDGSTFSLLTVPGRDVLEQFSTGPDREDPAVLPLDGLDTFDRVAREGADAAAGLLSEIAEVETGVAGSRLRYLPIEGVSERLGDGACAGAVFGLAGGQDGYLAVLFDDTGARTVADAMVPTADGISDDVAASATAELGGVMASGFLDGWAAVFDDEFRHTSPAAVRGPGRELLAPVLDRIATQQDHALRSRTGASSSRPGPRTAAGDV
jgi:chemotaxis protein CheY-P-specific phosphatase CheC